MARSGACVNSGMRSTRGGWGELESRTGLQARSLSPSFPAISPLIRANSCPFVVQNPSSRANRNVERVSMPVPLHHPSPASALPFVPIRTHSCPFVPIRAHSCPFVVQNPSPRTKRRGSRVVPGPPSVRRGLGAQDGLDIQRTLGPSSPTLEKDGCVGPLVPVSFRAYSSFPSPFPAPRR